MVGLRRFHVTGSPALFAALALPLRGVRRPHARRAPRRQPGGRARRGSERWNLRLGPGGAEPELVRSASARCAPPIQTANARPARTRSCSGTTRYTLSLDGARRGRRPDGDLDVTSDITIEGEGYPVSLLDGKQLKDRIFDVHPAGALALDRPSLMFGETAKPTPTRALLRARWAAAAACAARAPLTLDEVYFFRCASSDDGGCMSVIDGTATLSDSVFATCRAKNEGGGVEVAALGERDPRAVSGAVCRAATGGGIVARGALTLRNATFTLGQAKLGGRRRGARRRLDHDRRTRRSRTTAGQPAEPDDRQRDGLELDRVGREGRLHRPGAARAAANLEGATSCGFTATNDQQNMDPGLDSRSASTATRSRRSDRGRQPGRSTTAWTPRTSASMRMRARRLRVARRAGAAPRSSMRARSSSTVRRPRVSRHVVTRWRPPPSESPTPTTSTPRTPDARPARSPSRSTKRRSA